jgi:TolA-binding protein
LKTFKSVLFGLGLTLVVPGLVLLPAPSAKAAKSKSAKKKKLSKVELREQAAMAEAANQGPSKKVKLSSAVDSKMSDFSVRAQKKRGEVIKKIRKTLPRLKGPDKADLIFQLAELFWNTQQFFYRQEYSKFDKALQVWYEAGGDEKTKPKLKTPKADAFKKQALKNYAILLKSYPRYQRRDQVLYVMAYNLYEAGKQNSAVRKYVELVKKFPKSEYAADAYLALGEHFFNNNRLGQARKAFVRALKTKKEKVITFATYKLAWCDYNAGQYAESVRRFKAVIKRSAEKTSNEDAIQLGDEAASDIVIAFSHLDEVGAVYDYLKKVRDEKWAKKQTSRLGALYMSQGKYDLAVRTYRYMVKKYPYHLDAPMYQSNIVKAFKKLNKRDRVRTEANRLVDLYKPTSLWAKKVERMGTEQATDAVERAYEYTEGYMRQLVTDFHSEAQKTKRAGTYRLARDIYRKYLDNFSDKATCSKYETCDQAYRLRFFYAEILYDLKEFRLAAVEYDVVVAQDAKGAYAKNAGYAAILCWEFIVKGVKPIRLPDSARIVQRKGRKKKKIAKTDKTKVTKILKTRGKAYYTPKKISADEVALANACDNYTDKAFANSKDPKMRKTLIEVKFKAASIYHKYFHFEEAAKRYAELIKRWPKNRFAAFGAEATLDSFAVREQYVLLNKYGREFKTNSHLMKNAKFSTAVSKYVEGATFQIIMAEHTKAVASDKRAEEKKNKTGLAEAQKMFSAVATRFLGFKKEFPKSQFTPISLTNAMMIYDKAEKIDRAIEVGELMLSKYPAEKTWDRVSKLPKLDRKQKEDDYLKYEEKVRWALPGLYVRLANFKRAAEYFEQYYEKYESDSIDGDGDLADALWNALLFRRANGDTDKVIELREAFMAKFGKKKKRKKDIANVTWQLALSYETSGQDKKAAKMFYAYPAEYGDHAPPARSFDALYRTAMIWEAEERTSKDISLIRKRIKDRYRKLKKGDAARSAAEVRRAVGYARYRALDGLFAKFNKMEIKSRKQDKMAQQLKDKKAKLEVVAKSYGEVILLGDPETAVASLTRIGLAFASFADAIRNSPDPKGLSLDQLEIYRAALENLIFPNEQKAIEWLEKSRAKSFEVGVYNKATLDAQEALKRFKANEFPEIVEMPFHASESFALGE